MIAKLLWLLISVATAVFATLTPAFAQPFDPEKIEQAIKQAVPPQAVCERSGQTSKCVYYSKGGVGVLAIANPNLVWIHIRNSGTANTEYEGVVKAVSAFLSFAEFRPEQVASCLDSAPIGGRPYQATPSMPPYVRLTCFKARDSSMLKSHDIEILPGAH